MLAYVILIISKYDTQIQSIESRAERNLSGVQLPLSIAKVCAVKCIRVEFGGVEECRCLLSMTIQQVAVDQQQHDTAVEAARTRLRQKWYAMVFLINIIEVRVYVTFNVKQKIINKNTQCSRATRANYYEYKQVQ